MQPMQSARSCHSSHGRHSAVKSIFLQQVEQDAASVSTTSSACTSQPSEHPTAFERRGHQRKAAASREYPQLLTGGSSAVADTFGSMPSKKEADLRMLTRMRSKVKESYHSVKQKREYSSADKRETVPSTSLDRPERRAPMPSVIIEDQNWNRSRQQAQAQAQAQATPPCACVSGLYRWLCGSREGCTRPELGRAGSMASGLSMASGHSSTSGHSMTSAASCPQQQPNPVARTPSILSRSTTSTASSKVTAQRGSEGQRIRQHSIRSAFAKASSVSIVQTQPTAFLSEK